MNKNVIRKLMLNKRSSIKNQKEKSHIICERVKKIKEFNEAKIIGIYFPIKEEVDTIELINYAFKHNILVCLPKVINDKEMEFYKIVSIDELVKGKFNLMEPKSIKSNLINPKSIECFIVPLIAFDEKLYRVGYGKGYYDRYFKLNMSAFRIGLAYKEQKIENSIDDITNDDVKLNCIITD